MLKFIRRVEAWDKTNPDTLKDIPRKSARDPRLLSDGFDDLQFEFERASYLKQLKGRLSLLRERERVRKCEDPVSGLDVEEKLRQLAGMVKRMRKSEKDNYPQNANLISATFDDNQRRTLYALLEEIVEGVPWQGVRWLYPDEMRDALDESSGKI